MSRADDLAPARRRRREAITAWGSVIAPTDEPRRRLPDDVPGLDAQRGLAVLLVVVFHVYQFCNTGHFLFFGSPAYTFFNSLDATVPWLFVIAGFCAFEPMARSILQDDGTFSVRRFLGGRAVRLLPVYYVAVIMVWLLRQPSLPGDWRDLLEHLTFTQVFDQHRIFYTVGPAWAVSVAVWFYLLLALVGAGIAHRAKHLVERQERILLLTLVVAAFAAISLGWKAVAFAGLHRATDGNFPTWFGPVASLDNFAVGMAVALVVVALPGVSDPSVRAGLRALATVVLLAACFGRQAGTWSGVYFSTACSVGFGCLVAAAVLGRRPDRPDRTGERPGLGRAWPSALGVISCSIYLWHEPLMLALRSSGLVRQSPGSFWLDCAVVLGVSIGVGWLSQRAIERPIRQIAAEFTQVR